MIDNIRDFLKTLVLGPLIFIFGLGLFFFVIINGLSLLTGMEDNPRVGFCYEYKHQELSNFEYYFVPTIPYACKPNGGLLQPALSNLFNWLGETHK